MQSSRRRDEASQHVFRRHFHLPDKSSSVAMQSLINRLHSKRRLYDKHSKLAAKSQSTLDQSTSTHDTSYNTHPANAHLEAVSGVSVAPASDLSAPVLPTSRHYHNSDNSCDQLLEQGCQVSCQHQLLPVGCHDNHWQTKWPPRCASTPPIHYNMASALRPAPKPGYGLACENFRNNHCTGHNIVSPTHIIRDFSRCCSLYGNVSCGVSDCSLDAANIETNHNTAPGSSGVIDGLMEEGADDVLTWRHLNSWHMDAVQSLQLPCWHPHSVFYRRSRQPVSLSRHTTSDGVRDSVSWTVLRRDHDIKLPAHLDVTRLECYLSDEEFASLFAMSRDQFNRLPSWRRNLLKRKVHLY